MLFANYKKETEHNAELTKRCKQLDISLFKRNAELTNYILTSASTPTAVELERKLTDAKSTIRQLQLDYKRLEYGLIKNQAKNQVKKLSTDDFEISDMRAELLIRNKQIEQLLQIIKSETSCLDADLYISMIKLSVEL